MKPIFEYLLGKFKNHIHKYDKLISDMTYDDVIEFFKEKGFEIEYADSSYEFYKSEITFASNMLFCYEIGKQHNNARAKFRTSDFKTIYMFEFKDKKIVAIFEKQLNNEGSAFKDVSLANTEENINKKLDEISKNFDKQS